MTLISYAQNYEDVMLFRALGDIERGFYVDVGAQDPVDDSVTKAFYERGWRGINIEPVERWHDKLKADRPHDVNLRLLVTSQPGHATLYEVADSGLSTMDRDLAMSHAASGRKVTEQQLECVALDTVLAQHAPPTIHFLKVDVEGAEREVLEGLSLQRYRPWILVIEARAPNSDVETHDEWEQQVLSAGYSFVYQDGLNRFYLADEHANRAHAFSSPPNVLDDFVRHGEWRAHSELRDAQAAMRLIETGERIGELSNAFNRSLHDATTLEARVAELTSRVQDLGSRLEASQQISAERAVQAEDLNLRLQIAQELVTARGAELSGLSERLTASGAELSDLSERLEKVQLFANSQKTHIAEIEARCAAAERLAFDTHTQLEAAQELATVRNAEIGVLRADQLFREESADRLQATLDMVLASKSWRITRPMRALRRVFRHGPGELVQPALRRIGPGPLRKALLAILRLSPTLSARVETLQGSEEVTAISVETTVGPDIGEVVEPAQGMELNTPSERTSQALAALERTWRRRDGSQGSGN